MISNSNFINRVEELICSYGNEVTEGLRKAWRQICNTFNEQIQNAGNPETKTIWKALQSSTGSGKTTSLIVYAAMLSELPVEQHPGMLIVTRLTKSADDLASEINRLAKQYNPSLKPDAKIAISYHSKNEVELKDIKDYPVLVVCHAAYVSALEKLGKGSTVKSTWEYFYPFFNGERKLIVIDESINLVEEYHLTRDNLQRVLFLCVSLEEQFPSEISAIRKLLEILQTIEESKETKAKTVIKKPLIERYQTVGELIQGLKDGELRAGVSVDELERIEKAAIEEGSLDRPAFNYDFDALKMALRTVKLDEKILAKTDAHERTRLRRIAEETLVSINAIFKSWVYASKDRKHALVSAKLLVPDDIKGAVILDATAGVNLCYDLFEQCIPIEPPKDVRTYQNATVHFSKGHRVGKEYMEENSHEVCENLMKELEGEFSGREVKPKVLIVTHKSLEAVLNSYESENFIFSAAHWNAIDGSNEWSEYDAVVIFGLPYKPKTHSINLFKAFQGVQSTEWLQSDGDRPFMTREGVIHDDIVRDLELHQILTDVIQAINRIRCRRIISAGHCPKADVYILLPNYSDSEVILNGLAKAMPNMQFKEWVYTNQKREVKRSKYDEGLITLFRNMATGEKLSRGNVKTMLDIPKRTFNDLADRINKGLPDDPLVTAMKKQNIHYSLVREGRSTQGYFFKL